MFLLETAKEWREMSAAIEQLLPTTAARRRDGERSSSVSSGAILEAGSVEWHASVVRLAQALPEVLR